MRTFTQEEYHSININGYELLPTYFLDGTFGRELAQNIVKCLHNEIIVDNSVLDELIFLCYSNGAKFPPLTAVIPRQSFQYVENFKRTLKELTNFTKDTNIVYNAFIVLYLNNIIRIYPEEAFDGNLAIDRTFHYSLPPVTEIIRFVELIEDLIEHKKPAFILFINYQDSRIEQITASKIKNIVDKEDELTKKLELSENTIAKLNEDNKAILEDNKRLSEENQANNEKNKSKIITIVSLIAAIIPFFIININVLVNSFNLIILLCINGIMCFMLGTIYYFINKVNNNSTQKASITFMIIGAVLLVLGILLWILAATIPTIKEFLSILKFC